MNRFSITGEDVFVQECQAFDRFSYSGEENSSELPKMLKAWFISSTDILEDFYTVFQFYLYLVL